MYGTISVKITAKFEAMAYLEHQCQQANSLINSTLYHVRMAHFDACPKREFFDADGSYRSEFKTQFVKAKYAELCLTIKDNPHYTALPAVMRYSNNS
jgi:putative transposase